MTDIEYYLDKETDPIKFLQHFRRDTEPIGGGTVLDDNGDLVEYEAALSAIELARKQMLDWLARYSDKYVFLNTSENTAGFDTSELIADLKEAVKGGGTCSES